MVALPPCFFCKINSASERIQRPCFMNDGNLLRPSIYLNPRHRYTAPPASPPQPPPLLQEAGILQSFLLGVKYITIGLLGSSALPSTQPHTYNEIHSCLTSLYSFTFLCGKIYMIPPHSPCLTVCFPFFTFHQTHSHLPLSSLVQMIWSTWRKAFCCALVMMTSSNTEKVFNRP